MPTPIRKSICRSLRHLNGAFVRRAILLSSVAVCGCTDLNEPSGPPADVSATGQVPPPQQSASQSGGQEAGQAANTIQSEDGSGAQPDGLAQGDGRSQPGNAGTSGSQQPDPAIEKLRALGVRLPPRRRTADKPHVYTRDEITSVTVGSVTGTNDTVTDADLAVLHELPKLEAVHLLGLTKITDASLLHLQGATQLESLHLSGSPITDEGLRILAENGIGKNLELLDLEGTSISDDGLDYVAELPALRRLWVSGTGLTDAAVTPLKRMRNVKILVVANTRLSEAAIAELRAALPNTQVLLE